MKNNNSQYITVPNLFTSLNLFSGFLAVILAISGRYAGAAWLIFMASVFDGLDGRIARVSGTHSEFGLQMDSLADVISAGMAPSILIYEVHFKHIGTHAIMGVMLAFLPLLFAAFRLARFNVMTYNHGHQNDYTGMPAPMAATTLASIVVLYVHTQWAFLLRFLVIMTAVVSLTMISHLRYDGLPHFNLKEGGKNRFKLLAMLTGILFVFIFPEYTFFTFMMIYFISGPFRFVRELLQNRHTRESASQNPETFSGDSHS